MQCLNLKVSGLAQWRYGKNSRCPLRLVVILKNYFFILFNFTAESVNCSLLKNLDTTFLQFHLQKKKTLSHTLKIHRKIYRKKFIGDNLLIIDIALRN